VRGGNKYTVYLAARSFYKGTRGTYDVVVDEINTIPFMTTRYVNGGEKIVALIHQLAKEFWHYELPYPVAWLGANVLEERWLKKYKNVTTITVSDSTKRELIDLGFNDLHIVPNGLNAQTLDAPPEKTSTPSICFVGRMKKSKKPEDVIEAYRLLKKKWPELALTMAGDGYLRKDMMSENPDIDIPGYLDKESKDALVKRSWAIAVPGVREGWGQVITDANALGTPAVGYDVPGLRDSIKDGYNGLLVDPNPRSMAEGLDKILSQEATRNVMSRNALEWSRKFSWDKSAALFEEILERS
jgi:glycosyltransferase involved in cell wall biosynthesis